jgi:hypothetical protein
VWGRHPRLGWYEALEDGDTATRLICIDVKQDSKRAELNWLPDHVRHTGPLQ